MATGIVKFFKVDRGYGFIAPDGGGADVFVHAQHIASSSGLSEGQRVSFEIGTDPLKGKPQAQSVRVL